MLAIDNSAIIKSISGQPFVSKPYDQEQKPGTVEFLQQVRKQGHRIYIVANQGGIVAGYKTLQDTLIEQQFALQLFPMISAVCMADDYITSNFWFVTRMGEQKVRGPLGVKARKPSAGMLKYLESLLYEKKQICWMVGDSDDDVNAAESAGWDYLDIEEALKLGKLP